VIGGLAIRLASPRKSPLGWTRGDEPSGPSHNDSRYPRPVMGGVHRDAGHNLPQERPEQWARHRRAMALAAGS
jgi:hypothetical protein